MDPESLWGEIVRLEGTRQQVALEFVRQTTPEERLSIIKRALRGGQPMISALTWLEASPVEHLIQCFGELVDVAVESQSQTQRALRLAEQAYRHVNPETLDPVLATKLGTTSTEDLHQLAYVLFVLRSDLLNRLHHLLSERKDDDSISICESINQWRETHPTDQ